MKKDVFVDSILGVLSGSREALHAPSGEVEPGEEVLGTLENPIARAMYSLMSNMDKAKVVVCKKLNTALENEGGLSRELINKMETEIHQARSQAIITHSFFWELVHQEFPKSRVATVSVGLREGWKVVIFKNNNPSLFDQLQMAVVHSGLFERE